MATMIDLRNPHIRSQLGLSGAAEAHIEQAIKEGRFGPGEQLPSERQLSIDLGISRPVLREAISVLAERGFVRKEHGRGVFITDIVGEMLRSDPLAWIIENQDLVHRYYESRLALEPTCAALAAERASNDQIQALRSLLNSTDLASEVDNLARFVGLDIDFHGAIARMAANPYLERMLEVIIRPETDMRTLLHYLPDHLAVAQARHNRVLVAIEARDSEGAKQAMWDALTKSVEDIRDLVTSQKEES